MQLPPMIKDFLLLNPFPSLSFLPMTSHFGDKRVVFFLQDEKRNLEKLLGKVPVEITFYEEEHAYVMRLTFMTSAVSTVESRGFSHTKIEIDTPFYETEFFKKASHVEELKSLFQQDDFELILYDRYSGYLNQKVVSFTNKEPCRKFFREKGVF